ncbi:MAG: MerR family transcriptional regulator [Candidatus Omnitrophica bacterium]|nr:MerR family transcriptional regulator [Candidatus Omnitrophota bacterium]
MSFTVGQLAKQSGVNIETIRFYERKGLLPRPPRSSGGYRQYSTETISRVRFIKRSQELGFSLKEVAELLSLRIGPEATCGDIKRVAEEKAEDIDQKIRDLRQMKKALSALVDQCSGDGSTSDCPILEHLEKEGEIK